MSRPFLVLFVALLAGAPACDRRIEPFDPNEKVEAPDLSRIFPEGARMAEEREQAEASSPTPAGGRGAPPVAGDSGVPPIAGDSGAPPVAGGSGDPIRGTLELAPELEGSVPRGGVVFLVARGPGGGPPVAVKRIPEPSFPLDFEIGPDDRMIQTIPFQGPLQISARVDGDGNATSREPGDLSGAAAGPVEPGAAGVTIRIDQKL
jgi:cytochrome c-type biogenesis protein CcmH